MSEINDLGLSYHATESQDTETQNKKGIKKAEKKALKNQKRNEKYLRKSNKKYKKVEQLIRNSNVKLENINNLILSEHKSKKIKKLKKKRDKIESRIERANISIMSKTQRSLMDNLKVKVTNIRRWIIILFVLIFIIVCASAIWIYYKYEESGYYNSAYNSVSHDKSVLEFEMSSLKSEIASLKSKMASLESEISSLESKNSSLESKVNWFDQNCKIVIADEGALYKTYHTYDCNKWRGCYVWIYNKEQVVNNSEYIKCPDCN